MHQVFRRQIPLLLSSVGFFAQSEEAKVMPGRGIEYRAPVWCVTRLRRGVLQCDRLDMPTFYTTVSIGMLHTASSFIIKTYPVHPRIRSAYPENSTCRTVPGV